MEGVNTVQREEESERVRRRAIEGRGSTILQWIQPVTRQSPKNMFMLRCYKGIPITGSKI